MFPDLPTLLSFYRLHYLDTTPLIRPAAKRVERVVAKYDFEGSVCAILNSQILNSIPSKKEKEKEKKITNSELRSMTRDKQQSKRSDWKQMNADFQYDISNHDSWQVDKHKSETR